MKNSRRQKCGCPLKCTDLRVSRRNGNIFWAHENNELWRFSSLKFYLFWVLFSKKTVVLVCKLWFFNNLRAINFIEEFAKWTSTNWAKLLNMNRKITIKWKDNSLFANDIFNHESNIIKSSKLTPWSKKDFIGKRFIA